MAELEPEPGDQQRGQENGDADRQSDDDLQPQSGIASARAVSRPDC